MDEQSRLAMLAGWRREYVLGESKFSEVGPRHLVKRARQRFFHLGGGRDLGRLTDEQPQKKLDSTWYVEDSGALRGHLFVQNQVHLYPPALFSFVVGLQVSRIHICGICGNYFWAGRKDKKFCSPQGGQLDGNGERKRYMEIKLGDRVPKRRNIKRSGAKEAARSQRDRERVPKKG